MGEQIGALASPHNTHGGQGEARFVLHDEARAVAITRDQHGLLWLRHSQ